MSKKIKLYDVGDCVEVTTWEGCDSDGFFHNVQRIGLVLEAELFEMEQPKGIEELPSQSEWMYRVILASGRITEVWDYEIKPVNVMGKEYNNISRKPEGD